MKKNLLIICLLSFQTNIFCQNNLFIDDSFTAEQMVMDFFMNSCVMPSNITFTGAATGFAYFEGANSDLGINAGIVLSSGAVQDLPQSADVFASTHNNAAGDSDLDGSLSGGFMSNDAAVLEFDITVMDGGELSFQYIFGSEEYPEYVGSSFNDAFAFFVEGPGLPLTNFALVPDTNIPVAINNVNSDQNADYYVPYGQNNGQDVVLDGLTTELLANFSTTANETYHVKIVVGDISDGVFDSAIFLGIESLCGEGQLSPIADADKDINGNTVSFTNNSRYATSWHWDFGDNTTSDERNPAPHTYIEDGLYTVTLTTENWCCTDIQTFEVQAGFNNTNEALEKPFELYPNPANDFVQIQSKDGSELSYELFDLTGKVYFNGQTNNDYLNIAELPRGVYSIKVTQNEEVFIERLIVQ